MIYIHSMDLNEPIKSQMMIIINFELISEGYVNTWSTKYC